MSKTEIKKSSLLISENGIEKKTSSKRLEVLIWPLRRVSEAEPVAATDLRDAVVSPTLP